MTTNAKILLVRKYIPNLYVDRNENYNRRNGLKEGIEMVEIVIYK